MIRHRLYPPPPAGYFELPTTAATIRGCITRIDDALRYACKVREKALRDGDTTQWAVNAESMDQLLRTRAALGLELSVLGEPTKEGTS